LNLLGLDRGFDSFVPTTRDHITNRLAKRFLRDVREPFFLWLHYFNPHDPYTQHAAHDFGDGELERYDSEVASVDASIGGIFEHLGRAGVARRTIIVVTADHGEEFREHGGQFHTNKLYEELLHVPLIVSVPGVEPARIDQVVELIDIAPTLCEVLALSARCDEYDGKSLWATRAGLRDDSPGLRGAYSEAMMRDGTLLRRSLLSQGFRLTVNLDLETLELFDVTRDPREAHNVAREHPDRVRQLRDEMALRPYWRLAKPFAAASDSDSTELVKALPRVRSEPLLRRAVEAIIEHPSPGSRQALELLKARPGLGPRVRSKLDEALFRTGDK
jgi:arylsulfatase A-like enzyme